MKDLIRRELDRVPQPHLKRLALAEILQHLTLQSLSRHGAFQNLVFTGGTALRLLYRTNRYSEDLDFSLLHSEGFEFQTLLEKVAKDLKLQGLGCEVYPRKEKTVRTADCRFPGLLKEFNLSDLPEQKLTLKWEIDTRPPKGGKTEVELVTTPISYAVTVFDLPSLFALKLHALFFRRYRKGRDVYDLVWYLGRGVMPNLKLLNNAIRQTQGGGSEIKEREFPGWVEDELEAVDWKAVRLELERFVLDPNELEHLKFPKVKSLLRHYA